MRLKKKALVIATMAFACLCGCGKENSGHGVGQTTGVADVINSQMESDKTTEATTEKTTEATTETTEQPVIATETDTSSNEKLTKIEIDYDSLDFENVDYDLTTMDSTMVYSTVYNMMVYPEEYIGKTVKMNGPFYNSYYDVTDTTYHYVIIKDATACCQQGLEFVVEDENYEYPPDESEITVTGVFEVYQEDTDPSLYCHLTHAKVEN